MENCVVFDWGDAERHERECFAVGAEGERKRPEEVWGEQVAEVVRRRAGEVRREREALLG